MSKIRARWKNTRFRSTPHKIWVAFIQWTNYCISSSNLTLLLVQLCDFPLTYNVRCRQNEFDFFLRKKEKWTSERYRSDVSMATSNNRLSGMQCKQFSFNPQYPFRLWKCVVRFVPVCCTHTYTDDLRQICAPLMYGNSTGCWILYVFHPYWAIGYRIKTYVNIRQHTMMVVVLMVLCVCVCFEIIACTFQPNCWAYFTKYREMARLLQHHHLHHHHKYFTQFVCLFKAIFTTHNQITFNQEIYTWCVLFVGLQNV